MVRRPRVVTRKETQRRSDSSQKRWLCRLGRKRRRLRLFAWETVLPVFGRFPVTWQTRDMAKPLRVETRKEPRFIPGCAGSGNDRRKYYFKTTTWPSQGRPLKAYPEPG